MNGTVNINGKEVNVIESHQQELQNLVNTIKIYDPSLAQTIENGTFTQNINDILPNIIDNIQTNTKDYGVKIFDVTYADKQDTKVLTEAIARYLESNKGEYEI
jgi:tRNA/tmRNA/rRNA uracil-C5-methylase (TrmA/RlmC/RlmD family)